jgi:4-amino-4-deoxy-L-arabinose transferase-like glycosyltransferase
MAGLLRRIGGSVNLILFAILVAALLLRMVVWTRFADLPPRTFDEREYSALAVSLVERGEFALKPGQLTSARPPLTSAMIAGVYRLFGLENYQAVRLLQIGLNLLTVLAVYVLGVELFNRPVGLLAAALCAFYPSLWGHDYLLLSEVLFTFWLCLAAYGMVRFLRGGQLWAALAGGVLLGLTALTRSVMWPFPLAFVVLVLCAVRMPLSRRLAGAGLFLAAFAATLAPWAVRNTRLQGTLTIVDSSGGRILNWAMSRVAIHGGLEVRAPEPQGTEGEREKEALTIVLDLMRQRPLASLELPVLHFRNFWGLERELVAGAKDGNFGPVSREIILVLAIVVCGYYVFLMFTGVLGFVMCRPADRLAGLVLVLVVAHICLIHTLVYGHSRYHIPVMPFVMLYSASALGQARNLLRVEYRPRLWYGMAVFAAFAALWTMEFFHPHYFQVLRRALTS